ncbi:MAG: toll/interleukin-1 receptor domain-containing protein [Candidatus Marinimicrobia bacterium]|nr:toll/interleukin-1 receptor domain-containing protein [Candidatus Neomarinimicrobiota bacterium]
MPSIFLSHSSKDKFFVRELAERLNEVGIKVWIDEAELNVGDSLTQMIGNAIDKCDYFGIVLSENSINSEWVQKELQIAMHKEIRGKKIVVLPILLENVILPPFLSDKLYADFSSTEKYELTFPKLLRALGVSSEKIKPIKKPKEEPVITKEISESERKLTSFVEIKITDLDINRSYNPDETKALYNMYIKLSSNPQYEWKQIFEAERRFPRHSMWRRAWVEGDYIVVYCVPDELEKYHLRDIKEDVNMSNIKYRSYLKQKAQEEAIKREQEEKERNKFIDMKKRLGF